MPRDCSLSTTRTLQETRDRLIENFRSRGTKIHQDLRDIRRRFNERIGQEIVKVTSDAIAEALTKRVLTVRTAQRGENVDVVITRGGSGNQTFLK